MKIFVLVEHEYGNVYFQVFTTRELAEEYKKNECTGYVTITEQNIIGEQDEYLE